MYDAPAPEPEVLDIPLSAGGISAVRHYPNPGRARILFCHGTGLASDGFRPFWARLTAQYDLLVMDFRGHGHNRIGTAPIRLELLVEDLGIVVGHVRANLPPAPLFGIFHSIAGVVALRAALDGANFDGFILFEPALAPATPDAAYAGLSDAVAASTAQRRSVFSDPQMLARRLVAMPVTALIPPENATILAEALLKPANEGWVLRCPPEIEANLYRDNHHLGIWHEAGRLRMPILIQSGRSPHPSNNYSGAKAPDVAHAFAADLMQVGQSSHFGWIVNPVQWAALCDAYLIGLA